MRPLKSYFAMSIVLVVSGNLCAQRAWENDNDAAFEPANVELDFAQHYAQSLQNIIIKNGHCLHLISTMDRVAKSSSHAEIRVRQIDRIFDAADRAGCVLY